MILRIGSSRAESSLLLAVCDSGAGFGRRTLSEIEMGTGLGATCVRLASMYPGQHNFSIRDLPEGGAEISIRLPFHTANKLLLKLSKVKILRLLIVDDEPLIRSGIRSGMESIAHLEVIAEAGSGAEAIHAIFSLQPDVQSEGLIGIRIPPNPFLILPNPFGGILLA